MSNLYSQETQDWQQLKDSNPTLDTDKDGIPDWWEIKYGLNPKNRFDAKLDSDGDKLNNLQEFQADTDPKVAEKIDGVPKDWLKFYGLSDPNADDDKDGASNKEEFEAGTDPKNPEDSPKKEAVVEFKRPQPSMAGVRENIDPNISDNHEIRKGVFKYNDPIGDDKGPGYYTYPTNPVYVAGGFDIVSFEVDTTPSDTVIFKITVNADLKQDWGMAADFDIQHFQIYIDTDRVPGSGNIASLPGVEILFSPEFAWDRVVIVSPQPNSRVQIEVDVKAKDVADSVVIPIKISKEGSRTIVAVVKKNALGVTKDTDFSKWAWQVVSQSNEGFPDPEDLLTRNVNEYRGLHRFGGGSDDPGDPELMDILVWPAKGTLKEAEDQFSILNVWVSSPDPKLAIKSVVPMIDNEATSQWAPAGGYEKNARDLAAKVKPPVPKDKYVSDNFTFAGSVNVQWYYNYDNTTLTVTHPTTSDGSKGTGGLNQTFKPEAYYDNNINSRFTLEWYGKVFSDMVNFYARVSTWWGADSQWDYWKGNYYSDDHGPQYVSLDFEAFRFQLVQPIPTVDYISIGNYEYGLSPWTIGNSCYPDRDKYKGIFVDGSSEFMNIRYNIGWFYPFPWLGVNWGLGSYTERDNVLAGMFKVEPVKGFKLGTTAMFYSDNEMGLLDTNSGLTGESKRLQNLAVDGNMNLNLKLFDTSFNIDVKGGYSKVYRGSNVNTGEVIIDGGAGLKPGSDDYEGYFGVSTLKIENILGTGLKLEGQGFYVYNYYSIYASRGDYANAASQDVLDMYGNQSAHCYPQDAANFQKYENVPWESVADGGWIGGTGIIEWTFGLLNLHGEYSMWTFSNPDYLKLPEGYNNGQVIYIPYQDPTNTSKYLIMTNTINYNPIQMRAYALLKYKLDIGNGIDINLSYLFNKNNSWWPFGAMLLVRGGMSASDQSMIFGFDYWSHLPKIMLYYQFTKLLRMGLGLQYRHDIIYDLYPGNQNPSYIVRGLTGIFDFQYSTPLGIIRSYVQGYVVDNPRKMLYGGIKNDFRVPFEYFGNKYNIVALTELDIHF